jgi:hypothetical protein
MWVPHPQSHPFFSPLLFSLTPPTFHGHGVIAGLCSGHHPRLNPIRARRPHRHTRRPPCQSVAVPAHPLPRYARTSSALVDLASTTLCRPPPSTSLRAGAPPASGGAPCQSVIYCVEGRPLQTPPRASSPASSSFLRPRRRPATGRLREATSSCLRAAIHPRTPTTELRPYPVCTGQPSPTSDLPMRAACTR